MIRMSRLFLLPLCLGLLVSVGCYSNLSLGEHGQIDQGADDGSGGDDQNQGAAGDGIDDQDDGTGFGDDAGTDDELVDGDGDGHSATSDCDDGDPSVHPEAPENCNGIDDDCDGVVDEEVQLQSYIDGDGDGFGDDATLQLDCEEQEGRVELGGDCDDDDPQVYPGNPAQVDGLDSDCDGARDWLVTFYLAVDDAGEFCLNDSGSMIGDTGGWTTGNQYEIWLESGVHTIGIKGWDLGQVITAAIAHVEISDGTVWVSDDTWRYDPNPAAADETRLGWCEPFFDDEAWDLVLDIGPIGDSSNPWGDAPSSFPADSPAHWIWDHFPVNLNTQYLRKEFELP